MRVLYIIKYSFPNENAPAIRAQNICRLLKEAGHSVHVIAGQLTDDESNIDYCTAEGKHTKDNSIVERERTLKGNLRILEQYLKTGNYDAVLVPVEPDVLWNTLRLKKKYKVILFVEWCEWSHVSYYKLKYLDPRYYQMLITLHLGIKSADGIISISRLLHDYSCAKGLKSIRIPTILNVDSIDYALETNNEKMTIVFAGTAGSSKELLAPIIKALANEKYLREKIEFHIYGTDLKTVKRNVKDNNALDRAFGSVIVHGIVEHAIVEKRIKAADYMYFIRPNRRSSNAGFPTKLGECMALGTPPITNNTGDISLYVDSWQNGVLLERTDVDYVQSVLRRLLELSEESKYSMRRNARETAEKSFSYSSYAREINNFLNEV